MTRWKADSYCVELVVLEAVDVVVILAVAAVLICSATSVVVNVNTTFTPQLIRHRRLSAHTDTDTDIDTDSIADLTDLSDR